MFYAIVCSVWDEMVWEEWREMEVHAIENTGLGS